MAPFVIIIIIDIAKVLNKSAFNKKRWAVACSHKEHKRKVAGSQGV